nr:hypothetical protein [Tanacetum cinerariifolium]
MLEIHKVGVSTKDANKNVLKSLPSAWSNISLIMRNKPGIDNLDIDDLYNNLKVYEADIKGSSGSSSNSHNVAFVSAESTSSTNELNAAYSISTATGHSSQAQEDLEQTNQGDLEEMDIKWQVAMLSMILRGNFARDCRSAKNSGNVSRDAGNAGYRGRDNDKRHAKEEDEQALVVQDGLGTYDWSYQVEEEATDFALMAFTSNPSSSLSSNFEASIDESNLWHMRLGHVKFKTMNKLVKGNLMSKKVTSLAKDEKDTPKTSTVYVEKPKEDRSSAPLIEDWETDSDDDNVFTPEPIPAKIDFVKASESVKHVEFVKHIEWLRNLCYLPMWERDLVIGKVDQFGTMFKE